MQNIYGSLKQWVYFLAAFNYVAWAREIWGKYNYPLRMYRKHKRCKERRENERQAIIRFWTDIICNAGENAVHSGQFPRSTIDTWYTVFGDHAGLVGLLPKHLGMTRKDQRDLKNAILKRIGPNARLEFKAKKAVKRKSMAVRLIKAKIIQQFRNAA